jgi:hypothetical protein
MQQLDMQKQFDLGGVKAIPEKLNNDKLELKGSHSLASITATNDNPKKIVNDKATNVKK